MPELDEDRAEFLEHHPESFARRPAGVFVGFGDLGEPGHRALRNERAESVTGDDANNLSEPRQVHGDRSVSFGSDWATFTQMVQSSQGRTRSFSPTILFVTTRLPTSAG